MQKRGVRVSFIIKLLFVNSICLLCFTYHFPDLALLLCDHKSVEKIYLPNPDVDVTAGVSFIFDDKKRSESVTSVITAAKRLIPNQGCSKR